MGQRALRRMLSRRSVDIAMRKGYAALRQARLLGCEASVLLIKFRLGLLPFPSWYINWGVKYGEAECDLPDCHLCGDGIASALHWAVFCEHERPKQWRREAVAKTHSVLVGWRMCPNASFDAMRDGYLQIHPLFMKAVLEHLPGTVFWAGGRPVSPPYVCRKVDVRQEHLTRVAWRGMSPLWKADAQARAGELQKCRLDLLDAEEICVVGCTRLLPPLELDHGVLWCTTRDPPLPVPTGWKLHPVGFAAVPKLKRWAVLVDVGQKESKAKRRAMRAGRDLFTKVCAPWINQALKEVKVFNQFDLDTGTCVGSEESDTYGDAGSNVITDEGSDSDSDGSDSDSDESDTYGDAGSNVITDEASDSDSDRSDLEVEVLDQDFIT